MSDIYRCTILEDKMILSLLECIDAHTNMFFDSVTVAGEFK